MGFPGGSEVKASASNAGDPGSIPGSGRSPGEGNGNPLQYYCLKNRMDGGTWWATVHGFSIPNSCSSVSCSVISNSLRPHGLYVARQSPVSMGFSRQEYWSGLLFPSPGGLHNPGIKPWSPALQTHSLPSELQGSPHRMNRSL